MKFRLLLVFLGGVMLHAAEVRVNEKGQIEAQGADVRVFRGDATTPLFGSVSKEGGTVCFVPALPFVPGERYRVKFQSANGRWDTQHLRFELPKAVAPSVRISPSSPTVLPANALKIYLHFSHPMEQGVFLDRIMLLRQDGSVVSGAFRETELWSPDGRRLTLWLHPGRQKTGVNLNRDEGPVLREGETHTLKIAATWRSAEGVALGKEFVFSITAGAVDHSCPDPQRWKIIAPKAASREPLTITFDEALDPAMLATALTVSRGKTRLSGVVHVAPDARSWSFLPVTSWQEGAHILEIDPLLEDLAGNNLRHPFEVDLTHGRPVPEVGTANLDFEVR